MDIVDESILISLKNWKDGRMAYSAIKNLKNIEYNGASAHQ
jgi:hypothetical protein